MLSDLLQKQLAPGVGVIVQHNVTGKLEKLIEAGNEKIIERSLARERTDGGQICLGMLET